MQEEIMTRSDPKGWELADFIKQEGSGSDGR